MRMLSQVVSKVIGTFSGLENSQFEGLDTSHGEVAVKSSRVGSQTVGGEVSTFAVFLIFEDESSHNDIGMSSNVFGDAVVGDISTEEKG